MSTATIEQAKLNVNGTSYMLIPAVIERTTLGYEDHGVMVGWLHLEYRGSGQGAGGYVLDSPEKTEDGKSHRVGTGYGLDWIIRVLETVGVDNWESLSRARINILKSTDAWGPIEGIANILRPEQSFLVFKDHARSWEGKTR